MFCRNCGNNLPEGAVFCDKCGASAGVTANNTAPFATEKLSKKDYLKSGFCTDGARTRITASWVIFGLLALWMVVNLFITGFSVGMIMSEIDFDQDFESIMKQIEDLSGESTGVSLYTEEDLAMFEEFEAIMGMTVGEFFEIIFYVVFIFMGVFQAAIIIIWLLAVIKKSFPLAVTGLVTMILFNFSLITVGASIALLVMINYIHKEYKQYSENYLMFGVTPQNGFNEPNFGA